jgi:hypothetical protein
MTPAEAAEALHKLIPRRISAEMLSDYGIDATEEQAGDMTREVLSFALYWVSAAINAHIPQKYRDVLFHRVLELIQVDWATEFKLQSLKWEDYLVELEERRALYKPVGDLEGGAMAASEAISDLLEEQDLILPEDRPKLLVLLPDLVPLDQYQTLLAECI